VGLGGVLVCSFLGGMRAVTWTQVAQYLVLILAYLVPLTWLSVQQTGSLMPAFSHGTQLIADRPARGRVEPGSSRARSGPARWHQLAVQTELKLKDVRARDGRGCAGLEPADRGTLRAQQAPLVQVQRAERDYLQRPRTEAQARLALPAGTGTRPYPRLAAGGHAGAGVAVCRRSTPTADAASIARYRSERINFIALMLCLMMGTAAMPHVLTRFFTTRSAAEARRSVAWSLFFITLLYLAAPTLAVMVKFEVHAITSWACPLTSCRSG
jgi:cation/acetate symporter